VLDHSKGIPLRISRWNLFQILFSVKPFSDISYKKGGVFCFSCYLLEIIPSSMLPIEIICLPEIGILLMHYLIWLVGSMLPEIYQLLALLLSFNQFIMEISSSMPIRSISSLAACQLLEDI
jgi:hypothetical protein